MPYDLSNPRKLPLSHGKQVILNTANGDTHEVDQHDASIAMLSFFKDPANSGWGQFFDDPKDREQTLQFMAKINDSIAQRKRPEYDGDLIKVGPFVTWDACTHEKNEELLAQAMERFVELGGDLVRPIDRVLAAQLRMEANAGLPNEPEGLVAEERKERGKVHTVKEVTGRGDPMNGLPPALADVFRKMGVQFKEISPGTFMGSGSLDDFLKGDDDEDKKKD